MHIVSVQPKNNPQTGCCLDLGCGRVNINFSCQCNEKQKNLFAESVFKIQLHFFLISDKGGFLLPSRIKVKSNKQFIPNDNKPI